jgi:glycerol-3-phosphate dehydrogenase subunit C
MSNANPFREGSLEAPTRHPLGWRSEAFWNEAALEQELERVFDLCHGCRRCVSLCHAFPTLFDLVDASATMEVDGVAKAEYARVVDQCYLCDLCYQTKCPYIPPHPWNIDFPHLMLRAKAVAFRKHGAPWSARVLSHTMAIGRLATIPIVVEAVNAANRSKPLRGLLERILDVHRDAKVPVYHRPGPRKRLARLGTGAGPADDAVACGPTRGKVAIFATCYGQYNMPQVVEDLAVVLGHNGIPVRLLEQQACCGMPKLELGDLDSVDRYMRANLPVLLEAARQGWDILAPIPSCVLMFRQEIPLMYPDDADVAAVKARLFDPFEYLMHRHRDGRLRKDFPVTLGKIAYHAPCHQRVQNIGPKTREVLGLVPGTSFEVIERCSGHDGTYGVKAKTYALSRRIARPVETRVAQSGCDHFSSDCPMAGEHIAHGLGDGKVTAEHPISLLRHAYGL